MVATAVAVRTRADPKGAVHGADTGAHRSTDDPADRPSSAVATSGAFLSTADETLCMGS